MLKASCITAPGELDELAPSWRALHRASGASPFQSPEWLLPWIEAFGAPGLRVACLWNGTRLTGLLPGYRLGPKLLLAGGGISDQLDLVLAPDAPAGSAGRLLDLFLDHPECGQCDLSDVPSNSPLCSAPQPPGWTAEWSGGECCPILALPDCGRLAEAVPASMLRKLRMNQRRAERLGGSTIETARPETLQPMLNALFRLHAERWPGGGVFGDRRVVAFHRRAAPLLLGAGMLRLQALRLGGEICAVIYALLHGADGILFYISGYSAARSFESPGTLLLGAMLAQAAQEGRREANFLRGREAYKYRWGAADRVNQTCQLRRRSA